jgi:UDP-2,3-diacylglucosamine pyrophosphatase LpxH
MTPRAYVLGDFHLGAGPKDPLEDFKDDGPFASFCEHIAGADTTLILNGDVIDFVQIPPFEVPAAAHLLWTEEASRIKLAAALAGHRGFFAGLAHLISRGTQIVYLLGNHDVDAVFPAVQAGLRAAIGAGDAQLRFGLTERYHGVHIEHGFQFTPENCPQDPTSFVHIGDDGKAYLERVWGTDFMLQFFNRLEASYPYADNVKPMLSLVWHGLKNGWIGGREVVRMLVFLKRRGLPWKAIASGTLADPGPLQPAAVATSFDDPQWQAMLAARAREPGFVAEMKAAAAELDRAELARVVHPSMVEIAAPTLGKSAAPPTLGLFGGDREERAAHDRLSAAGVTGVVFGHTHDLVNGALDGCLYNHGTWLPALDLKSPVVKAKIDVHGLTKDMLADASLYRVDRCGVRLDPDPPNRTRMRIITAGDP